MAATPASAASAPEDVARAVERLRLAEASLARRRQTDCGPSETARATMRMIYDGADAGRRVTPTDIAGALGVSTPTMTTILQRLHAGGLVSYEPNPDDGRSKFVAPSDRNADIEGIDPLTARIRDLAKKFDAQTAGMVAGFLDDITEAVNADCR